MKNKLYELSERIELLKDKINTEEATKQSFILPFFQILGYDVFNPLEFCPEFTADVGIKKKEKVDYAIIIEDNPFILIEAKSCLEKLDKHSSQLFRYFGTTEAKFAILTNGIQYRFYTDLDAPNKMDDLPFFEINFENLSDNQIKYIEFFKKSNLNTEELLNYASDSKYTNIIKSVFTSLINNPSPDFVKVLINDFYTGVKTQQVVEKFTPLVRRGINSYINDKLSATFNQTLVDANNDSILQKDDEIEDKKERKIVTTLIELEGFTIIKWICKDTVDINRITYKDTESYLSILLDNNRTQWIARLYFNRKQKYLCIPDENKKEIKLSINNLNEIYNYQNDIVNTLIKYIE